MTLFEKIGHDDARKSEPAWHPAVQKSFLFVPTAGMRVAPEVLVLELYRETFYPHRSDEVSARRLVPNPTLPGNDTTSSGFSEIESTVLYASRGRRKQNTQSKDDNFYTPAFPSLTRFAWLRRKSDRVIRDFLFRALSQSIHGQGKNAESLVSATAESIYRALSGTNTAANESHTRQDILSLELNPLEGCVSRAESIELLRQHLGESTSGSTSSSYKSVFRTVGYDDPLASRIDADFLALCELETILDRLQWLDLLKCFLRLATSVWLLAHMRQTVIVRDALLAELSGTPANLSSDWPVPEIRQRHRDLLRPSITPTKQIHDHIDAYMRARVELNLLVTLTDKYDNSALTGKIITIVHGGSGNLPLDDLLILARKIRPAIESDLNETPLRDALTRECEGYKAWVAPRKKGYGQGVNYDEFLRVLRRMTKGDEDGGYLLTQKGNGFVVFPGQQMLKLVAHLSSKNTIDRRLVLADLESHFESYGIDFGTAAGARPRLISTMQEIGMLKGSPDAGDSVEIERPYG